MNSNSASGLRLYSGFPLQVRHPVLPLPASGFPLQSGMVGYHLPFRKFPIHANPLCPILPE
jgi:hypothetical protein